MQNCFVLLAGDGDDTSVLRVSKALLLFRMNSLTDSGGTEYVVLRYMECTSTLDEVDEKTGCVFLKWSSTTEEGHSAV